MTKTVIKEDKQNHKRNLTSHKGPHDNMLVIKQVRFQDYVNDEIKIVVIHHIHWSHLSPSERSDYW